MTKTTTSIHDEIIDAYAQAGLSPYQSWQPRWTASWDAVADLTDDDVPLIVVARYVEDDERIDVKVTNEFGAIHVELSFPATDIGLAMMIGAIGALA
jgi:hypothetical protein